MKCRGSGLTIAISFNTYLGFILDNNHPGESIVTKVLNLVNNRLNFFTGNKGLVNTPFMPFTVQFFVVQRICAIYQYNSAKNGKGLIPYGSMIGLGAFRKIKYFGDIPRQLLCIWGFDHKVKIIQKHIFAFLLIHSINPTAERSSKTDSE